MAYEVMGKNMVVSFYRGDGYYAAACVQDVTFTATTEMLATTTADSGYDDSFYPRTSGYTLSLAGVMFLRDQASANKWMGIDFLNSQRARELFQYKIIWTDKEGYTKTITGYLYIESSTLSGTAGQLAKWNIECRGTGAWSETVVTPTPVAGDVFDILIPTVIGQNTVASATLFGKEIIEVNRGGLQHDDVSPATPVGRQFKFVSAGATGTLTFDAAIPFKPNPNDVLVGENIHVVYKVI